MIKDWAKLLAILKTSVSPFSVLGSLGIMYHVYSKKPSHRSLYHRLIFGLSSLDLLCSSWLSLGPIPTPRETGAFLARGNFTTCSALGFFWNLTVGVAIYNAFLMLSFVAMVRYHAREETLKRYEPFMHLFSILFPVVTGTYSILNKFFNPTPQSGFTVCYIEPYPPLCDIKGIECTRGPNARLFRVLFLALPAVICLSVIFVSVFILWWTIWQKERQTRRISAYNVISEIRSKQALIYGIFFFNTYFWILLFPFIDIIFGRIETKFRLVAQIIASFFFPSQGFWNFLICIRPQYNRIRLKRLDQPWYWAFYKAATGASVVECGSSSMHHGMKKLSTQLSTASIQSGNKNSTPSEEGNNNDKTNKPSISFATKGDEMHNADMNSDSNKEATDVSSASIPSGNEDSTPSTDDNIEDTNESSPSLS